MTAPVPAGQPSFRARLVALLDEYDTAPRGTSDHLLAAYVRGCLSGRDALELRVAREARRQGGSTTPRDAQDPRPEVTGLLAVWMRRRTEGRNQPRHQAPVVSS